MPLNSVVSHCTALARCFGADRRASMAMMFSLAVVPSVGFIAAAMDYTRASDARTAMQKAADAAALAAAASARDKIGTPLALAHATYEQNVRGITIANRAERLVIDNGVYRYEASGSVTGSISSLIGGTTMNVQVNASATYGNDVARPTEIVFVADASNSMSFGNSWQNMVAAISDTLSQIKGTESTGEFFVSLLPMSDRIRFSNYDATWSSQASQPKDWRGCWEPREVANGTFPHALDDEPPGPTRKFTPSVKGMFIPNHIGSQNNPKTEPVCPGSAAVGPTGDIQLIRTGLTNMKPGGTGRFDEGMAWAWRLLSPKWRDRWGAVNYPANKDGRRKVVILMTDGHTTAYDTEVGGATQNTSFGWNMGSRRGFEHLVHLCERMKASGIEIYSFWTGGNSKYEPYAKACATDQTHYFARTFDAQSFKVAFAKITGGTEAKQSSALRLIK